METDNNKVEEISDQGREVAETYKVQVEEDLANIPIREPKTQIDAQKYKGTRVRIAKVGIFEVIDYYTGPKNAKGLPTYNPNSTEKKRIVEIETYPLPELDADGNVRKDTVAKVGEDKHPLTVTARFNLKKEINKETGKVEWVVSKAPQSKLWAFMRKQSAKTIPELKDTIIVLDAEPSSDENDDRFWLRISL